LYGIEQQANKDELSIQQRVALRKQKAEPILDEFHKWVTITGFKTSPKGLLGKAIGYTLSRWEQLILYLNHGFVPMDNNLAEM
jgi:transposase